MCNTAVERTTIQGEKKACFSLGRSNYFIKLIGDNITSETKVSPQIFQEKTSEERDVTGKEVTFGEHLLHARYYA